MSGSQMGAIVDTGRCQELGLTCDFDIHVRLQLSQRDDADQVDLRVVAAARLDY